MDASEERVRVYLCRGLRTCKLVNVETCAPTTNSLAHQQDPGG